MSKLKKELMFLMPKLRRYCYGLTGNKDLGSFQKNTKLVKITSAGLNESHVHGISITRESPNYQLNK